RRAVRGAGKTRRLADYVNFDDYRRLMIVFLWRYMVLGVADGTEPQPPAGVDPADQEAWESKDLFVQINNKATAREMWAVLLELKTRRDSTNSLFVLQKLQQHYLKRGMEVKVLVEEAQALQRRLEELVDTLDDVAFTKILKTLITPSRRSLLLHFVTVA
ncbi:hypothetical protein PybrP1_013058, partial [[Pythium] brassicae (nom. inval.)]